MTKKEIENINSQLSILVETVKMSEEMIKTIYGIESKEKALLNCINAIRRNLNK